MPTFHVLLATIGRSSLQRMINSLVNELLECDHLTIVFDGVKPINCDVSNIKCTIHIYEEERALGYWGHEIRNKYAHIIEQTDFVLHADDDDVYVQGTFNYLRTECDDNMKLYIAQMKGEKLYPENHDLFGGNIGTPMGIIPYNYNQNSEWGLFMGGDGFFYENISRVADIIWLPRIIYLIREYKL